MREETTDGCPVSLVVEDGREKKNLKLCDSGDRTRHLYTSQTSDILLHFSVRTMTSPHYYYMVHYKGVCSSRCSVLAGREWCSVPQVGHSNTRGGGRNYLLAFYNGDMYRVEFLCATLGFKCPTCTHHRRVTSYCTSQCEP